MRDAFIFEPNITLFERPGCASIDFEGFPRTEGRDAFVAMMDKFDGKPGMHTMHHAANPIITLMGQNEVKGKWSLYFSIVLEPASPNATAAH